MRDTQPRFPRAIAVASGKGGCGKTTIAANLAVALASRGLRVALFDADMGLANANLLLGLEPQRDMSDLLADRCGADELLTEGPGGVALISGGHGVAELSDLTPGACHRITDALGPMGSILDLLVVDTAPGLSVQARGFIGACETILLVVGAEPAAFLDAYALMKTLRADNGRRAFLVVGSKVNDDAQGGALFEQFRDVAGRFLDVELGHAGTIPFDAHVHQAAMQRRPLVTVYPDSRAALAFGRLADLVAARLAPFPSERAVAA